MAFAPPDAGVGDDEGQIWIHRPFRLTPDSSASASVSGPIVRTCRRPPTTPPPAPEERLHRSQSLSSLDRDGLLRKIRRTKAQLYEAQSRSRVGGEGRRRMTRRSVTSPSGRGSVDVTICTPAWGRDDEYGEGKGTPLAGVCLHVHGGGWLWGDSCHQVAHRCLEMAEALDAAVVSVEYCLIGGDYSRGDFDPVHDVSIAMEWIESRGAKELNARPSFVGSGESSGAHLLLLAMLHRRDESPPATARSSGPSPWKCLNLVYGVYDLSGTPSVHADGDTSSPLSGNDLLWLYDQYCSEVGHWTDAQIPPGSERRRDLSPLYADLSDLPPALISVGTADPLVDDSMFLAGRYDTAGNDVELTVYEGGEHGVGHFGVQEDSEMGRFARGYTLEYMRGHLQNRV